MKKYASYIGSLLVLCVILVIVYNIGTRNQEKKQLQSELSEAEERITSLEKKNNEKALGFSSANNTPTEKPANTTPKTETKQIQPAPEIITVEKDSPKETKVKCLSHYGDTFTVPESECEYIKQLNQQSKDLKTKLDDCLNWVDDLRSICTRDECYDDCKKYEEECFDDYGDSLDKIWNKYYK